MRHRFKGKRLKSGFMSQFEERMAKQLDRAKVSYEYEKTQLYYAKPIKNGRCPECENDAVVQECSYTPDFILANGIILEGKGRWDGSDRQMHLAIRKSNPDLDIRFVFQVDNWMTKTKANRYSDWCKRNGFKYAIAPAPKSDNPIPKEWLK